MFLLSACSGDNVDNSTSAIKNWEQAYRKFMLSDMNKETPFGFPPSELRLIDLNFDGQPELTVVHNSGGSMGAVMYFYYYDGVGVKSILTNTGEIAGSTTDAALYFDTENKHSFLYKRILGFEGNTGLQYGYLSAFTTVDGIPFLNETLRVSANWQTDNYSEKAAEANTENEDTILLTEDLIVAEEFNGDEWRQITEKEYIDKRNALIIPGREYTDYMKQADSVKLSQFDALTAPVAEDVVIPTEDEMNLLFSLWHTTDSAVPSAISD
jgi:hypothetical protein